MRSYGELRKAGVKKTETLFRTIPEAMDDLKRVLSGYHEVGDPDEEEEEDRNPTAVALGQEGRPVLRAFR
jgi:hypothetical protein